MKFLIAVPLTALTLTLGTADVQAKPNIHPGENAFANGSAAGKSLAERRAERKARIEERRLKRQKRFGTTKQTTKP